MSHSLSTILADAAAQLRSGRRIAACLLVHARGSTPQNTGALMVVDERARTIGTIGGGCIEAEVRRNALHVLQAGGSGGVVQFKLNHDYGWDDGLICGGTVQIAIGSLPEPAVLDRICEDIFQRRATLLQILTAVDERPVEFELDIPPRERLYIAGAGHVGQALAKLAVDLDFEVWVFDDRADLLAGRAFSQVRCIAGDIAECLRSAPIDERTFVAILTRGHKHDEQALHAVVNSPAGYIGMIGSRRKIKLIHDDLVQRGVCADMLARVKAPIGVDISAVSVQEIALSIAAELVQHRRAVWHNGVRGPLERPAGFPADALA